MKLPLTNFGKLAFDRLFFPPFFLSFFLPVETGSWIAEEKADEGHSYSRAWHIPTAESLPVHKRQLPHVAGTPPPAKTPAAQWKYSAAQCSEVWSSQECSKVLQIHKVPVQIQNTTVRLRLSGTGAEFSQQIQDCMGHYDNTRWNGKRLLHRGAGERRVIQQIESSAI